MDNALSDEQRLLRASLERLIKESYTFETRRQITSSEAGWSKEVWSTFADLGLLGLPFEERHGGLEGGPLDIMIVMEAFGRGLVVEPYLQTVVLAGALLRHGGSEAQKQRFIPRIASGDAVYAVAFAEGQGRFNPANVRTSASRLGDGWTLDGEKCVVYGAPWANGLFVTARTAGDQMDRAGISVFYVPADAPGLLLHSYPTIDGSRAADITLKGVQVGPDSLVGRLHGGLELVERVLDEGIAAVCAEASGAMAALNTKTLEYTQNRQAFGRPISAYQVLQHRMVDMHSSQAYAAAMALRAAQVQRESDHERRKLTSAAKYIIGTDGRFVGQNAVHLHGAMGMTDELDIGHYFRRLTVIDILFGNADYHLSRYQELERTAADAPPGALASGSNREAGKLSPEDRAFQDEVRQFYVEHMTPEMRRASQFVTWQFSEFAYGKQWQKILNAKGWGAPYWPVEYGGCDWTDVQHRIFEEETARADPPRVMMMGRDIIAPCIMEFGTREQKALFLPGILSGDHWWAQGFSEPSAGSDLAALQLKAEVSGSDYVLNGSKIWTTYAHHATHIFLLVRTSREPHKHQGITCLMADINTPGIEVRPIINIAGEHEFNQVFFTDARVPQTRRLGDHDDGWTVIRHLLHFEHGVSARFAADLRLRLEWLRELASLESDGAGGRLLSQSSFARQIAAMAIGVDAVEFASEQAFATVRAGGPPPRTLPLYNLRRRALETRMSELAMEAVGYYGAPFQPEARKVANALPFAGPEHALRAMPFYLAQRALNLAGGTPEIHRNNLTKTVLGLR